MKILLLVAVAIMTSGLAIAAETLTPIEKSQVSQLALQTENSCVAGFATQVDTTPGPFSITQGYVKKYCGCIGNGLLAKVDAKMMRNGTEADGQKLVQSIAQDCAVKEFKANFPAQCKRMYEDLPRDASIKRDEQDVERFCGCLRESFDNLEGAQLSEVARQTLQEYQSYRQNPNFESRLPLSLINTSKKCARKLVAIE